MNLGRAIAEYTGTILMWVFAAILLAGLLGGWVIWVGLPMLWIWLKPLIHGWTG